jgi:hypothetical protein
MTGAFGSWNTEGRNPPTGIPGFFQGLSSAGPIAVADGQTVHVTGFASINNPEKLSGQLFCTIFFVPVAVGSALTPVGAEQEHDVSGDVPTFQIGSTALIEKLPAGNYIVGLAARVPPSGSLPNMLSATAGACTALIF